MTHSLLSSPRDNIGLHVACHRTRSDKSWKTETFLFSLGQTQPLIVVFLLCDGLLTYTYLVSYMTVKTTVRPIHCVMHSCYKRLQTFFYFTVKTRFNGIISPKFYDIYASEK